MRAFVLTHSALMSPDKAYQILNQTLAIETWISPYPYTAVLVSKLTVAELAAVIRSHFGDAWFVLVEANKDNVNGWLPQQFWDYVLNPQKAWSDKVFAGLIQNSPHPATRGLLGL